MFVSPTIDFRSNHGSDLSGTDSPAVRELELVVETQLLELPAGGPGWRLVDGGKLGGRVVRETLALGIRYAVSDWAG